MKVKNIVFSGFMAAIMMGAGATAANAAVSVASKAYVDTKVGTAVSDVADTYLSKEDAASTYVSNESLIGENGLQTQIDTLSSTVATNKSDADTAIAEAKKAGTDAATALDAYKAVNDPLVSKNATDIATNASDISSLKAKDIELAGQIQSNSDKIALLDGEGEGSVSFLTDKVNANAAAIETLNETAATQGSVANSIASALSNFTTEVVDVKDAATLASARAYTDTLAGGAVKNNADAIDAINAELDTMATSETVTALTGRVEGAETDIDNLQAKDTELAGGIEAAQAQADKGVADAAAINAKLKTLATADVPAACTSGSTVCVLTLTTNGDYAWTELTAPVDETTGG